MGLKLEGDEFEKMGYFVLCWGRSSRTLGVCFHLSMSRRLLRASISNFSTLQYRQRISIPVERPQWHRAWYSDLGGASALVVRKTG